ncbi:MAG: hypothetical protein ACRDSP_26120 [Pseudonocardiaceae bacterium]
MGEEPITFDLLISILGELGLPEDREDSRDPISPKLLSAQMAKAWAVVFGVACPPASDR